MKNTLKDMIAVRASESGERFYKSYIKNIKVVDRRYAKGWTTEEVDYTFYYKGRKYIVREQIEGNKMISFKRKYSTSILL